MARDMAAARQRRRLETARDALSERIVRDKLQKLAIAAQLKGMRRRRSLSIPSITVETPKPKRKKR